MSAKAFATSVGVRSWVDHAVVVEVLPLLIGEVEDFRRAYG